MIVGKNVFPQVRFVRGKTNLPRVHVRRIRPLREENPIVDLFLNISFQWEIREDLCFVSPFKERSFSNLFVVIVLHKRSIFFVRLTLI